MEHALRPAPAPESLPGNVEAEISVLGALLVDNQLIGEVVPLLSPDAFTQPAHRHLYRTLVDLYESGKPIDLVLLKEELDRRGQLAEVGGAVALAEIAESIPTTGHALHHARIVRGKAILRKLVQTAGKILRLAQEGESEPEAILDRAEQLIFEISREKEVGEIVPIAEVLKETFDRLDHMHDRKGRLTGTTWGFEDLDDITSGLQESELVIVAGRPSMGKTSLALNIIERIAVKEGHPVAIFSLEMSKLQLVQNLLCIHAKVDAHKMRRGYLPESAWAQLTLAGGTLDEAPIFIDDSASMTSLELRAKVRRLKAQHDIRLVVVDYLQLMEGSARRAENRQQEISEISRSLKALARELQIPVIALSQLSRAVEGREDRRPRMSDLRESGAIEQDADVIAMLFREDYYHEDRKPGVVDVIIAKQRNGPTGTVELAFRKDFMRFENLSADRGGPPTGADAPF